MTSARIQFSYTKMPGSVQSDFSITSHISLGSQAQDEVVVAASITTLPLELLLLIASNVSLFHKFKISAFSKM